jgi:integrase
VSVHRTPTGYVVRWRDGNRNRQRTFDRRGDAQRWDGEVRRRKQLGALATLELSAATLDTYIAETWAPAYAPLLAPKTRETYSWAYDRHIAPRLGHLPLHALTPAVLARWQAAELSAGAGHPTIAKAREVLSGVLRTAVESGLIAANPMRAVRAPRAPMREEVRPLAPATVEAIRAVLDHRNATIVSALAYAGLRPGELRGLRWGHVLERTIVVNASKTSTRRTVRLLDPLAGDLREWRMACGRPDGGALVFPNANGDVLSAKSFNQWRANVFGPALGRANLPHARPYDLRHSFASLLLHEGRSVIYVARQLGHGAEQTMRTYGHVIDELEDTPRITAEDAIRAARQKSSPWGDPREATS